MDNEVIPQTPSSESSPQPVHIPSLEEIMGVEGIIDETPPATATGTTRPVGRPRKEESPAPHAQEIAELRAQLAAVTAGQAKGAPPGLSAEGLAEAISKAMTAKTPDKPFDPFEAVPQDLRETHSAFLDGALRPLLTTHQKHMDQQYAQREQVLQQQIAELKKTMESLAPLTRDVGDTRKLSVDSAVRSMVPDWEGTRTSPEFEDFLSRIDPLTGVSPRAMIDARIQHEGVHAGVQATLAAVQRFQGTTAPQPKGMNGLARPTTRGVAPASAVTQGMDTQGEIAKTDAEVAKIMQKQMKTGKDLEMLDKLYARRKALEISTRVPT